MNSFQITLDGKKCNAEDTETILTVAERNGIEIPTLCYMKETKPYASCFICVVEVEGKATLLPSCATLVTPNMNVTTNSPRIHDTRKTCMDLLLSDHCGDCLAPCQSACPAGCDIPGFIHLLLEDKPLDAVKLIKESIPLPASLGRVCPKPCEEVCRRQLVDLSGSICYLKRYLADYDLESGKKYIPTVSPETGKKVAIIGGGPGGLSSAYYLRQAGHKVTVFDAHPKSGGMLRYGIPAYRLPRDVLDNEIDVIAKMGVTFKQSSFFGKDFDLKTLKDDGFDAIFIAVGAQNSSAMQIDGEEDGGALSGIDFLADASKGVAEEIGDRVVVVGGGNTAIDAARTSLRLGAKEVVLLYRRTRNEMPANEVEIDDACKEGVILKYLSAPTAMKRTNKGITLTCIQMELGEPDSSGRRRPVPIEGSEFTIDASTVISAIGQKVDVSNRELKDFKLTKWNTLDVNPNTFETSIKGIFAGGDCVTGADIAILAIATGKKVAIAINQFLEGKNVIGIPAEFNSKMGSLEEVPEEVLAGVPKGEREKMPEVSVAQRIKSFEEVELGYEYEAALREAKRCMGCGCNKADECKLRTLGTKYGANPERFKGARKRFYTDDSHPKVLFESHKCILCGNCVRYFEEVKKTPCLGFIGRGFAAEIRPSLGAKLADLDCEINEKLVEICPAGAFSNKNRFAKYNK